MRKFIPNEYRVDGDIAYLLLPNRERTEIRECLIDAEDLTRVLTAGRWGAGLRKGGRPRYYVQLNRNNILLHRFLIDATPEFLVDHINHNTLDCRKINLRLCDKFQNGVNRPGPNCTSTSGVLNVHWVTRDQKWRVTLRINGNARSFGQYHSLEEATEAARHARLEYFGEFAA